MGKTLANPARTHRGADAPALALARTACLRSADACTRADAPTEAAAARSAAARPTHRPPP
ncbi:hypothetical protein [Streptomyces sp. NBC_01235]|uniref:hypothetical protein n=1 Tax=Streptomyces sp. NBC_01235 TaxID=2903788 RepID=UPI002E0F46E3|nr:hypothetical protein OG289_34390 [Streptomyces sp. NBC_01235]